jgi:hypothetical protein
MGWNDHVDWQLHEEIEALVADGELEEGTPAYGVAQRVIHGDSLSPKNGLRLAPERPDGRD